MITLVNVKKNKNIITAYYYIEYDANTSSVVKYSYCEEDEKNNIKYGLSKATKAIEKMILFNKFPDRYRYIWY